MGATNITVLRARKMRNVDNNSNNNENVEMKMIKNVAGEGA